MALTLAVAVAASGCSDLGNHADATVSIQANDASDALQLRQKLLSQAQTWGGARICEKAEEQSGDVSLTFSLPGRNLDGAIDAVRAMGAQVDSTSVDVNRDEIERTTSTKPDKPASGSADAAHDGEVTLQVVVTADSQPAGAGAAFPHLRGHRPPVWPQRQRVSWPRPRADRSRRAPAGRCPVP